MKVFCVIPSWNCAETLPEVINSLRDKVDRIVVVDDGSSDNTAELLSNQQIDFIKHPINRGQGAALKTGTEHALNEDAEIIIHFDADGQFSASDIENVIEPISNKTADIVFGSRFLNNKTVMPILKKRIIMPMARFINRWLFNIKLTDPQSGFRALSRRAAEKINWQQDRMAHCSEILVEAHASGLSIKEVPIKVTYNDFGQRFGGGLSILKDLFIAKLNK